MSELGGEWVFPETFHHKRGSNVTLLRGLCPTCVTRLYEQREGRLVRLPPDASENDGWPKSPDSR